MPSPGTDINVYDLSVYSSQVSDAIVGCVGPATKGPVNALTTVTDEGTFVNQFGRPIDGHYAPRAAIRYFRGGNQLKFVRVAGKDIATAKCVLYAADGVTPIITLSAASPGSWANDDLSVAVTLAGNGQYNIYVYFLGQAVESFLLCTNGSVVTRIANGSTRVTAALSPTAGATLPADTTDPVTGLLNKLAFAGGNDGAFARSNSQFASTGPVAGKRFYGRTDASSGSRTWQNLLTIGASLAGKALVYGTTGTPIVPGTFTVRVQTNTGPTYVELSDNGILSYGPGGDGMGLLAPSGGGHTGFVDYRTGKWGVNLASGTLYSGGSIDAIWIRANTESVGSTEQGVGAYSGSLSEGPVATGFWNTAKVLLSVSVNEQAGIPASGASTSSSASGMKGLAGWIVPGTVVLTPTGSGSVPNPVYDDGFGNFRTQPNGGGTALTGAINYRTGVWSITWDPTGVSMPSNGGLTAAYDIWISDMGGGAVAGPNGTLVLGEVDNPSTPVPAAPSGAPSQAIVGGGSVDVGLHNYAIAFVTANGFSALGPLVAATTSGGNQTVNLSSIPLGPGGTTARQVWRTKLGAPTVYYLVATIADNTTTTYSDTAADASLTTQFMAAGLTTVTSGDTNAQTIRGPISPGTVKIVISATSAGGPLSVYDDGTGGWLTAHRGWSTSVAITGTINYATGAWSITIPASGSVPAASTITSSYTSVPQDKARRRLSGSGPQTLGSGGVNTAGMAPQAPSSNSQNGANFLDHRTGLFGITLTILAVSSGLSFDLKNGGAIRAVYAPASILGFGDGTTLTFAGTLGLAPYRRQANRLIAFRGSQAAQAGSGDADVSFAALGTTSASDYWLENVALSTDPANFIRFNTGAVSIKWSGAPLAEECVYVIAEEPVLNVQCLFPGDIGNERATLTSGFYVTVSADPQVAGAVQLQVMFNGVAQETWGQALSVAALATMINDPANGSKLISVTPTASATFIPVDTGAPQNVSLNGAFTQADIIGAKTGATYTGLQMFANDETVAVNWIMVPGQWHRSVISALQALCESRGRRCMGIIPAPRLPDPFMFRDYFDGSFNSASPGGPAVATVTVPYPPAAAIDSSQLATIIPWVTYTDQYSGETVSEPPDGEMAILIAGTPNPWNAIAGLKRGRVLADDIDFSASRSDRDLIYGPVGEVTEIVNPIINKVGRGLLLYGQRTAQRAATALDRINVRWTINVIMNMLDAAVQDSVFDNNDSILWRNITAELNAVLKPVVAARGLQDAFVLCDGTTTTAAMIDANQVGAKVFVKPERAAEYITQDLIITSTGVDFASIIAAG